MRALGISVKRKSTRCFGCLPLTKDLRKFGSLTKDKNVNFHPFCEEEPRFSQIFSNGLREKAVFPVYRKWNFYNFFCKRKKIKFCFPEGNTENKGQQNFQFPITAGLIVLKHLPPRRIALPSSFII